MKENPNQKIWAVSMAPGASQVPVHVLRKHIGSSAWIIHKMKEVGDPTADPKPHEHMGRPTKAEQVTIDRLEKEKQELQAKFDALQAQLAEAKPAKKVEPKQPVTA